MKILAMILVLVGLLLPPISNGIFAKATKDMGKKSKDPMSPGTFMGLKSRSIGPAFTSGRIADLAVNSKDHSEYYVAVAAGNVWKTTNSGVTWTPIFDKYGAWSIADVEMDPNNPHVVWIGTGEYNSQRAIGYGDGVYRSEDGGKSWKNMGLTKSEHIGRIVIDPRNSHVYAAAQGPLWGPGGERGLYKSTDNGKTWKVILTISENTGVTDIVMDPRDPDVLYAASYQRRRHVFTLINGGPESGIYKSTDAGATWNKLTSGLPEGDMGRIGLAISPVNPDVIYAIIEAAEDSGGVFRSTNRGATWEKQDKYVSRSPQYYNRLIPDPKDVDKVYSLDTYTQVTEDGGKTWRPLGNKNRHVDDHALWIDPGDTRHLLIGGDGGLYESFDSGVNWLFKSNLPVTQFYRVSLDNALPFYYVYGGTQDNNSMGGPSRTISSDGIVSSDWFVTQGGDGFETQVDPEDSNILYAQSQYGNLVRYDRKSGETIDIKPKEGKGEAYRWNWNSPLIISPHSHTRLYFGANILFRSDDRGNTWRKVSSDLTRQLDRNQLKVMGKIQSPEAVAKSASTSLFGNIVALSESPLKEGLLYVGTDDGLIRVSENGGEQWQKIEKFPGVPDMTYVCFLYASLHNVDTVYAAFDGRKNNDLKPYLLKSTDRGKTWTAITANLPQRGTVYTMAQDHVNANLLFAGTEFGVYFTIDGGKKWVQLKGGIPTTQVRDMEIQKRENDLVLATFGRGFYILDNYTPLRELTPQIMEKKAHLFSVKDALMFIPRRGRYGQGETYFKVENPELGATFTYYLKDSIKTLKQKRKDAEKKAVEKGVDIKYPTMAELRAEDNEPKPYLLFTVSHESGQVVRRLKAPAKAGVNRITWDLRYPLSLPPSSSQWSSDRRRPTQGMLVMPGKYSVTLAKFVNGEVTPLAGPQSFSVVPLSITTLPAKDRRAMVAFQEKIAELARVVQGTVSAAQDLSKRIESIKNALHETPAASPQLMKQAETIENQVKEILRTLTGDESISKRNENQPPSIYSRIGRLMYGYSRSTSEPTQTMQDQYRITGEEFEPQLEKLRQLVEKDLKKLEAEVEAAGAPWTPGRIPVWKK
ncbi:MAG: glycosyl hydrolase [Candidatus Aminicenantes bacterium]|nr:MAG: glycosyl hydrolase [Candidatus Aminicenantes bacterium]